MKKITKAFQTHPYLFQAIFSGIVAGILTLIFFRDITGGKFLFIGDEFLMFSQKELFPLSFMRNPHDLGVPNGIPIIVNFYERLYYYILHSLPISFIAVQPWYYFAKLFVSLFIPFIGFVKLGRIYKQKNLWVLFLISLWYSFNTYTLINWNGGFFITLLILYILAPLALYYYHQAVFGKTSLRSILLAAVILFSITFLLYICGVFFIFLLLYTILLAWQKKELISVLKRVGLLILAILPLYVMFIPVLFDILQNSGGTSGSLLAATAGNLSGGVLYQMILWSIWPIYNYWEPRNGVTFYKHLYTPLSFIAPFVLYGLILYSGAKKRTNYFLIFVSILLVFIFFAKGPQNPFGFIYTFLVQHFPPFILFRSPDNKFGFGIVFTIALLLLVTAERYSQKVFSVLIGAVILIQIFPLLNGTAIRGVNSSVSWERIIQIPPEQKQITAYLKSQKHGTSYLLPLPSDSYAQFWLRDDKLFIGQDLLSKSAPYPFIHWESYSAMPPKTYEQLSGVLDTQNISGIKAFPVRYILIRRDIRNKKIDTVMEQKIKKMFPQRIENRYYSLYENPQASPIIRSRNISFQVDNPVTYRIKFSGVTKKETLSFMQNYNAGWYLYPLPYRKNDLCFQKVTFSVPVNECSVQQSLIKGTDVLPLMTKPLFTKSHSYADGYANQWEVDPYEVADRGSSYYHKNADGSLDFELLLYFKPQTYFVVGFALSVFVLIIYSIVIVLLSRRKTHAH